MSKPRIAGLTPRMTACLQEMHDRGDLHALGERWCSDRGRKFQHRTVDALLSRGLAERRWRRGDIVWVGLTPAGRAAFDG